MTGAEAVLQTAAAAGIEVCFANPGTTEMALVNALDRVPSVRAVLGLFEGVCSGAADGYARMSGRPALTLLHLGPGLSNALANLHNARRARSPVVNLVGDQATWHRDADAPLTSDIVSLAKPVSRWVRESREAASLAQDAAEAIAAAWEAPGGVATLILPADCQAGEVPGPARPILPAPAPRPAADRIERVAAALRRERNAGLYLGGRALSARGRAEAAAARRRVDRAIGWDCAGRSPAGRRDRRRRVGHHGARLLRGRGRLAAPQPAHADRRLDRHGPVLCDRRRHRLPGPDGDQFPGGRRRHVHAAGAVDAGARAPARGDADLREPGLSHPAGRVGPRRRGVRGKGALAHGPVAPSARLGPTRPRHGCRSLARRLRRLAASRVVRRPRRARSASHRSRGVNISGVWRRV